MSEIYCLYSTEDGEPRYVGQTEHSANMGYKRHLAAALDMKPGALYDWIRDAWRRGFEIEYYVLQEQITLKDLDLFESYWTEQFPNLWNVSKPAGAKRNLTETGRQVCAAIRDRLNLSGIERR